MQATYNGVFYYTTYWVIAMLGLKAVMVTIRPEGGMDRRNSAAFCGLTPQGLIPGSYPAAIVRAALAASE